MGKVLSTALVGTILFGFAALGSQALAQAKTAKACTEEWRADKANFQAKGITEKAYVEQCRSGATAAAPAPTAAPASPAAPAAPAPAPDAGQKTAKACTEQWRADKANFQAKGITEKAYVAQCRAGAAPAAANAPTPAAAPPAPPPVAAAPANNAGQKTAKACTEEWRADKANFQAKGITEKAYVAQCRSGATPATATAPPAAAPPAAAPPAAAPAAAPPPVAAKPAPAEAPASVGSPTQAGQYATEAQAKAACPSDTVVWANLNSKIYHFSGTHNYGNTKSGAYMCEKAASAQGIRAAKNEQHP